MLGITIGCTVIPANVRSMLLKHKMTFPCGIVTRITPYFTTIVVPYYFAIDDNKRPMKVFDNQHCELKFMHQYLEVVYDEEIDTDSHY